MQGKDMDMHQSSIRYSASLDHRRILEDMPHVTFTSVSLRSQRTHAIAHVIGSPHTHGSKRGFQQLD